MKKIAVISLAVILILITLIGVNCDSDEDNDIGITTLPERFVWYQNDEYGFKMAYSEDWWVYPESQDEHGYRVSILELFPPNSSMTDGAIHLSLESAFDISSLEAIAESKKEVLINGSKGHSYTWKSSFHSPQLDDEAHTGITHRTILEVNGKYYSIVCVCPEEVWDEKAPIFDTAIRSFAIE